MTAQAGADFLADAGSTGRIAWRRPTALSRDRCAARCARLVVVPIRRPELRMRSSAAECTVQPLGHTIAAFRHAWPRVRRGHDQGRYRATLAPPPPRSRRGYEGGGAVGEATGYPRLAPVPCRARSNVLFSALRRPRYQSDISRASCGHPTHARQRKVWTQMRRAYIAIKRLGWFTAEAR